MLVSIFGRVNKVKDDFCVYKTVKISLILHSKIISLLLLALQKQIIT